MGVMSGREMVVAPDDGCALCGLAEKGHGRREGLGHLGFTVKRFVPPSPDLVERRRAVRHEATTGLPFGGLRPDGEVATHLVRAQCRCGSVVMATPEHAGTARCTSCLHDDIDEKGASCA